MGRELHRLIAVTPAEGDQTFLPKHFDAHPRITTDDDLVCGALWSRQISNSSPALDTTHSQLIIE